MTPEEHRPEQRLVLYVDDVPLNLLLMRLLFEQRPAWRLEVAATGAAALALMGALRPALLLLDLRLPDCFGTDLLAALRCAPGWHAVPAVAVTAEADFEAGDSGFLEVWHKPLDLHATLARLDVLLAPSGGVGPAPGAASPRPRVAAPVSR